MSFKPRSNQLTRLQSRYQTFKQRQDLSPIRRSRIEERELMRQRREKQHTLSRATFEQTLAQPAAARQTGLFRARSQAKGFDTDVASSLLWRLKYDDLNQILYVWFNTGTYGRYLNVPYNVVLRVVRGEINPKTHGKNEYGEWYETKDPSVGATFVELVIKGGYTFEKLGQMARRPRIRTGGP